MGLSAGVIRKAVLAAGLLVLAAGVPRLLAAPIGNDATNGKADARMSPPLDPATAKRGAEIYGGTCSGCHDAGLNRAPQRTMLGLMTPESIDLALTDGVMRAQGSGLTAEDKRMVAEYISGRRMGVQVKPPLMCAGRARAFDMNEPPPFSGWGLTPNSSHAIPTAVAGVDRANAPNLKLKWALAFPNAIRARSQPAVAGGAIFVGSHDGTVFALDRKTGCARWTFHAAAEVRTGIVVSPWRRGDVAAQPLLYFGDLIGDIYAIKARTGTLVWRQKPDAHPNTTITAAPVLYSGLLYVPVSSLEEARAADPSYGCCTFRGSVVAYNAATGDKVWQTFMTDPPVEQGVNAKGVRLYGPSGVALWNSPAIDVKRGRLYFATGDNYSAPDTTMSDSIVALDLKTGRIVWAYQAEDKDAWNVSCNLAPKVNCPAEDGPDFDFGAGVVLASASDGHDYVVAGQKSGMLYGVNAEDGKLVWKTRVGRGGVIAGIHFGLAAVGDTVFVPVSDVPDGRSYDTPAKPGLYAVDIKTGAFRWRAPAPDICAGRPFCHPGYAAAITATPQLVFAGSDDGHLRIYDAASGKVLWDYNTWKPFTTVNGAAGHGGSIGGGAAPIVYKGMVFTNSGYGFAGAMGGNVFLAFGEK